MPDYAPCETTTTFKAAADQAAPATATAAPDPAYEAERQAALDALNLRQWQEYDEVHDGSGRSEEFPSDLRARHAEEYLRFEAAYPEQAPARPAPAATPKPGM